MVAAVSTTLNPKAAPGGPPKNPTRTPLLPSDTDNALAPRRPKSREVTSRYLSTSSSSTSSSSSSSASSASSAPARRCPSPLVSRAGRSTAVMTPKHAVPSTIKRSQSVERRRVATPRPDVGSNGQLSAAQKLLFTSARSLSVSFQGESFALQVSKAKPAPSPCAVRKGTPERRRVATPGKGADQVENSKAERWPGRLRQANPMSRSLDCADERKKLSGSGGGSVVRALQSSMVDNRASVETRLSSDSANYCLQRKDDVIGEAVGSELRRDAVPADTESVSSGSTLEASGAQERFCNGNGEGKRGLRGLMMPARFWQETGNHLRRSSEPGSPVSKKTTATPKLLGTKKFGLESPVCSPKGMVNSRGQLSPLRGPVRPASPSKVAAVSTSSPLRGVSPARVRNGGLSGDLGNTPSILSFAADVKRGKVGESRIFYAHLLRLLYNRQLQWRFVNARADAALTVQNSNAEKSLYNAWLTTSKVRDSVRAKRLELQLLRQTLKLISVLKGQMKYLDEWALLDCNYSSSLLGATQALKASTLRLPVVSGARADVQKVKNAISSAIDVMQAMAASINSLSTQVEEVNSLVGELAQTSTKEGALLNQCKDFLDTVAAMQVKECSLRTHIVQTQRLPSRLTTKM